MSAVHPPPAPLRVVQLVTTLARGGAQATVLASSVDVPAGPGGSPPIDVRVLAGGEATGEGSFWGDPVTAGIRIDVVPTLRRSIRPLADVRALRWLVAHLRAERPDVVHTHSSKAGVLGRLAAAAAGVPCVHTVHGWGPLDAGGPVARRAVVAIERILARRTAALVVVGADDLDRGLRLGIGRAEQYHLIRSGIEPPDARQRAAVRRELDLDGRWVVGMVGRLAAQKDQVALIEAFATVAGTVGADATLVLVGDGPRRAAVEAVTAANPGLDVRLLGARPDGPRLVTGFDVAVNAAHWEGLPRAVVEAASAGVPVVATDVGSTRELIRPGRSGRLVPPGDVGALAEAIADARSHPDRTAAMAAEAVRLAADYGADRMRDDLHRLWRLVGHGGLAGVAGTAGTAGTAGPGVDDAGTKPTPATGPAVRPSAARRSSRRAGLTRRRRPVAR
ncbi:MAG: glycosyltransferase family 4 protein [Actinomycetota bacterium]